LLAVFSKNNEGEVLDVLNTHPHNLLHPKHLSTWRINWTEKSANLRAIAEELNISTDSLMFIDDNPVECAEVIGELPMIEVLALPAEPERYASLLKESPRLNHLTILEEDRCRADSYAARRKVENMRVDPNAFEDYLRRLKMTATVSRLNAFTCERASQMSARTNQFNITARRYSVQGVKALAESDDALVVTLAVNDDIADHGVVGVAVVRLGEVAEIESLMLSCRILGRKVESVFLATIADLVKARGAVVLTTRLAHTGRNQPALNFLVEYGFERMDGNDEFSTWQFDLNRAVQTPDWISINSIGLTS
jgi:FkbH-like protein